MRSLTSDPEPGSKRSIQTKANDPRRVSPSTTYSFSNARIIRLEVVRPPVARARGADVVGHRAGSVEVRDGRGFHIDPHERDSREREPHSGIARSKDVNDGARRQLDAARLLVPEVGIEPTRGVNPTGF
jgi:hypothetical protein